MATETAPDVTAATVQLPQLLTEKLIRQHFIPIGSRTLERWISAGRFPAPDIKTGKLRFWKLTTVAEWMERAAADN